MKLLGVFLLVSLALHLLLLFVNWPEYTSEDELAPTLSMVEFTPVGKAEQVAPAQPQPEEIIATTPELTPIPEPIPAIEPIAEPEPADNNEANTAEEIVGEMDIAIAKDIEMPSDVAEAKPEVEPAEDITAEPVPELIEEPVADPTEELAEAEPETPAEAVEMEKPVVTEEPDRRIDVPVIETFVSDRIVGEIEFKGKGRRPSSVPPAPDFRLSNNTSVIISFKVNKDGRPIEIVIPPVGPELERTLRVFVEQMRFSVVFYSEPDEATMTINLKVR